MDKNAIRRQRYAEMTPSEKAALLQRRREARVLKNDKMSPSEKAALSLRRRQAKALKKEGKHSLSRIRKVPLGYVESGVCFPDIDNRDSNSQHQSCASAQMLGNRDMIFPQIEDAAAVVEGLEYMSSQPSATFGLRNHASSSCGIADPTSMRVMCKEPLSSYRIDAGISHVPSNSQKRKKINTSSHNMQNDDGTSTRKSGNYVFEKLLCDPNGHPHILNSNLRSFATENQTFISDQVLRNECHFSSSVHTCMAPRRDVATSNRRATNSLLRTVLNKPNSQPNLLNNALQSFPPGNQAPLTERLLQNQSRSFPLSHTSISFQELDHPLNYLPSSSNGQGCTLATPSQEAFFNQTEELCQPQTESAFGSETNQRTDTSVLVPNAFSPIKKRRRRERVSRQPSGTNQRRRPKLVQIDEVPGEPLLLPDAPNCQYCGAKRFHLEPPSFCCSQGEVSVVTPPMPYDLKRLFIGNDEESGHFRNNVRTYNNHLGFTSFAAKYDPQLTKNTKGVYTFRVQGQVYHFLNGLLQSGDRVSGLQFYFFDTDEELAKRIQSSDKLREGTLKLLMRILADNPYAKFFKSLKNVPEIEKHKIILNCYPALDQRVYNLPSSSQVAAIWTEDDDETSEKSAHIQVYSHSNTSYRIHHYYGCYDPLQYPILFPRGECGWHHGIKRANKRKRKEASHEDDIDIDPYSVDDPLGLLDLERRAADRGKNQEETVSAREYYCYRFQIRENDESMLLHTLRALQQFSVDAYVKIETSRLDFHRKRQNEIRTEILQGVLDSISIGQTRGSRVGRRTILPASFIGGPRDMRRRYLDAMALVQKYGKPDIFLTMTCNPMWKEIQQNLKYHEKPQDRPDLLARVFRAKFEMLKSELLKKQIFGEVAACVYVIEFQKRGFPHAHLLLILKSEFKLLNPESYDRVVCAEIPDRAKYPHLYNLVIKHMIHGPCGDMDKTSPCMRDGVCKNHYPKNFCDQTTHGEDTYPYYRRRNDGKKIKVRKHTLDNGWVVPYNPYLLALFDCHINVEICSTLKLVKYLYKYVFKGHDLVSFKIITSDSSAEYDEIKEFQQGRWVSPPEAFWRIYEFRLNEMTPAVYTMQVHLPNQQHVSFDKSSDLFQLISKVDFSKTMLTEFFQMNKSNTKAESLKCFYKDFPQYFVWSTKYKHWTERKRQKVIGRLVTVSPREGERYYLRLLLTHVPGPTSFDDLLSVNGEKVSSFREAALALGLLQTDSYIEDTLQEAVAYQMPSSLRLLFATVLVYCSPTNPTLLWEKFEPELSKDYQRQFQFQCSSAQIRRKVLLDINKVLEQMGKSIADYHFVPDDFTSSYREQLTKEIQSEMDIEIAPEDLLMVTKLNYQQKQAYDLILHACFSPQGKPFFVDGPGGTWKTFLYRALLARLRSEVHIAIAVATSGIAASILPGGRTAHSRFKIPLDFSKNKACQLSKQSSVARLIFESKLILWDEASMAKRETIEAFDALLRDITESDLPFGGKVVVFGGDFRQTLPVIEQASKDVLIQSSFPNSPLWPSLHKLRLSENMRAALDPAFSSFLLRVGEGKEPIDKAGQITLPSDIVIPYDDKEKALDRFENWILPTFIRFVLPFEIFIHPFSLGAPIYRLIESVFPDLDLYSRDPYSMINRCILAPKNASVDELNEIMIKRFPGNMHTYISSDKTVDQRHQGDYEDFLNSQNPRGLPPHKLLLKENCPIMLLRNLNPTEGLCNGTRLICRELGQHTISAEIVFGHYRGKKVIIPKIPLQTSDNEKNGIPFTRTQFPVRVCFALTINKSQGQTLDYVGIYLREPVFSHGQLYVALSRARTGADIKVLIVPGTFAGTKLDCKTRNIVFDEIFQLTAH